MRLIAYVIYVTTFIFFGSNHHANAQQVEAQQFIKKLQSLCGNSYGGKVIFPETPPRGFTDPLVAHFTLCEEGKVHIPFHVGENKSRTWMLELKEAGLLFKHDHRHEDGTPERMTNYGGWGRHDGTALKQYFPADEETIALGERLKSHVWQIELSEDLSTYSYSLYLNGELYFRADFDLKKPLN
jgi:hypothetical protein